MSGAAIAMMAVSMVIVWGGLVAAIINLRRGGEGGPGSHRDL
ncbi:methionine/alanine import family NSS transporter small subunit [Pseudactinotalea sp.]